MASKTLELRAALWCISRAWAPSSHGLASSHQLCTVGLQVIAKERAERCKAGWPGLAPSFCS